MKKVFERIITILCIVLLIVSSVGTAFAHSGRTDSSGGHKDNKNKSGLGSYHYHCGGYPAHLHKNGYCPYKHVFPSSVSVKPEKTTLRMGEKVSISASVYPSNACNTNVSWSCSDTSVISLSGGAITAKGYGTATITAETFNGKKSTIKITVKEVKADNVTVSGLPEKTNFYVGDTFILDAQITPEDVDNKSIVWSSSNDEVAVVSASGSVKLLAEGEAEIKATASNGVSDSIFVSVIEIKAESLEIEGPSSIFLGDSVPLTAKFTPVNTSDKNIRWSVDDPSVASVSDDGLFTTKYVGTVTITAKQKDVSATHTIEVLPIKVEDILITASAEEKVSKGDTVTFFAEVFPGNATFADITWSVSDPRIASINEHGVLTALRGGTVTVIATSGDGFCSEYEIRISSPLVEATVTAGIAGGSGYLFAKSKMRATVINQFSTLWSKFVAFIKKA